MLFYRRKKQWVNDSQLIKESYTCKHNSWMPINKKLNHQKEDLELQYQKQNLAPSEANDPCFKRHVYRSLRNEQEHDDFKSKKWSTKLIPSKN